MRVLLLGASGLLGRAMVSNPPRQHDVTAITHEALDIRDTAAVARTIGESRPDWIVNATAYTDVDGAESDRETAFAVNADAVGELAALCRTHGRGLTHFSTDYVFAGNRPQCYREGDPPAPVNTYGASKLAGEERVRESGARYLIIRTQWVYGIGGRNFLSTLWRRAKDGQSTRVVADEYGSCTYVSDLARVAWEVLGRQEGVLHVANRGRLSRFDFAQRIFAAAGKPELAIPCQSETIAVTARRPTSSMLCVEDVERVIGYQLPGWTNAVDRYIEALRRSEPIA